MNLLKASRALVIATTCFALLLSGHAQDNDKPTNHKSFSPGDQIDQQIKPTEPLSDDAALEADVEALWQDNQHVSKDQIRKAMIQQDELARLAAEIGADRVADIVKDNQFSTNRVMLLTQEVSDDFKRRIQSAGASFEIAGDNTFSIKQRGARAEAVTKALNELGFRVSKVNPIGVAGEINISLPEDDAQRVFTRGGEQAFAAQIALSASSLPVGPPDVQGKPIDLASDAHSIKTQGRALSKAIKITDLAIEFVPLSEIEIHKVNVRGGQYQWHGGPTCTSGWTARWYDSWDVWVTAAHCLNSTLPQLYDPAGVWDTSWYQWGYQYLDAAIVIPNGLVSRAFYASDTSLRNQGAVGIATVGDAMCTYGRRSNTRFCSRTVTDTGVCISSVVGSICYASAMSVDYGLSFCPGDSGGGVSYSTTMYGMNTAGAGGNTDNGDCNQNPNTNFTTEYFSQLHTVADWLSLVMK